MIEITNNRVFGIEGAMHGMRFPYESFNKQDTEGERIGTNDMELCKKLIKGGSEHRKFLRMIHVQAEVRAPRYYWSQADTYHFMVKNSSSTMHLITKRKLKIDDFAYDKGASFWLVDPLKQINCLIEEYNNCKDKDKKREIFLIIKKLLPESFMQRRFIDTNYEELLNIYRQRKNHRLPEWHTFCEWIKSLPYMEEFIEAMESKE